MPIPSITRYAHHTDHEHEARQNGFNAGWDHANYVNAYGATEDTSLPDRFSDVAEVWREAYQEGKDEFAASEEDEAIYGHDWRATESSSDTED